MRKLITLVATAGTLAVAAPVTAHSGDLTDRAVVSPERAVTVHVRNDFGRAVSVQLLLENGQTLKLGTVEASSSHVFQVAETVLPAGKVRLRATVEGTRTDLSTSIADDDTVIAGPFAAQSGSVVQLLVESDLSASRAWFDRG